MYLVQKETRKQKKLSGDESLDILLKRQDAGDPRGVVCDCAAGEFFSTCVTQDGTLWFWGYAESDPTKPYQA